MVSKNYKLSKQIKKPKKNTILEVYQQFKEKFFYRNKTEAWSNRINRRKNDCEHTVNKNISW